MEIEMTAEEVTPDWARKRARNPAAEIDDCHFF
jgi:hypothetical protein